MPISPPSDIVLGVANAADPLKYRAAAEQLRRAAGAKAADVTASGTAAAPEVQFSLPQEPQTADPSAKARFTKDPQAAASAAKTKAYKEFEAFLLQSFIESILPKDSAAFFGSGTAGDFWKSMFAEHVAREIADSSAFGIAESIADHKARIDKARTSGPNAGGGGARAAPAAALADPGEAQRNAAAASGPSLLARTTATGLPGRPRS